MSLVSFIGTGKAVYGVCLACLFIWKERLRHLRRRAKQVDILSFVAGSKLPACLTACLPIVASGQLQVSANCLSDGHSAFVGTRWMLQPVPARIGQALCITKPHRILGVCVAAILADPWALQSQGSRTYPRAKKARRAV